MAKNNKVSVTLSLDEETWFGFKRDSVGKKNASTRVEEFMQKEVDKVTKKNNPAAPIM